MGNPNWPTKNGSDNPSGKGRGNNPPRKQLYQTRYLDVGSVSLEMLKVSLIKWRHH